MCIRYNAMQFCYKIYYLEFKTLEYSWSGDSWLLNFCFKIIEGILYYEIIINRGDWRFFMILLFIGKTPIQVRKMELQFRKY